jgi:hypothetical protein
VIAVHDDATGGARGTDIVTQITVPDTTDDYGVILPVPSEPTLDPEPVLAEELDRLDAATAPRITTYEEDSGGGGLGCACGSEEAGGVGDRGKGVSVSEPMDIGPVTAVVLSGTTDAVNTWLGENGFVISEAAQATIADYAGYFFVAIRRNERTAPGGPTSIGIHYHMANDHRELPLRFAALGAAPTVAFTLFFSTKETLAPSAPFAALTLGDLNGTMLQQGDYEMAVEAAVRAHDNRAFVLESRSRRAELLLGGGRLQTFLDGEYITRMSTILPVEALTEDVHFHDPYPDDVPNGRTFGSHTLGSQEAGTGVLGLVLLGVLRHRKRRTSRARASL